MLHNGVAWIGSLGFSEELSFAIGFSLVPWVVDGESEIGCSVEVCHLE